MVQKDFTGHGATKPMSHTIEPVHLESRLCKKRSHCNEKPMQYSERGAPALCNWRKPRCGNADPVQTKTTQK